MTTLSARLLGFVPGNSRLHQLFDQGSRERLVRGEVDGTFGGGEGFQFVLEGFDNRGGWKQAAVVRKRCEPYQHAFVLERRYPVADDLGGLQGYGGLNRRAKFGKRGAGWFRDAGKVFLYVFRSVVDFRPSAPPPRFGIFHEANATAT